MKTTYTIKRDATDGSVVRYVRLANNRRVGGTTQAEVLVNFGREDTLDLDALRRLVASINRYLGEAEPDVAGPLGAEGGPLEVESARPVGAVWLLDGLWTLLGVADAVEKVLGSRRFRIDVERALFALVANRAIKPDSKRSAAEWASRDVAVPGLTELAEQHVYRAMDLLIGADAQGAVHEAVFFAAANLLHLEVDLIFFDTTSTYFERDDEDEDEDDDGEQPLRRFGHSQDHRRDLPQIVIGLAVTREGIPVRVWAWPNAVALTGLEAGSRPQTLAQVGECPGQSAVSYRTGSSCVSPHAGNYAHGVAVTSYRPCKCGWPA